MRRIATIVTSLSLLAAGAFFLPSLSQAADGKGVYGAWTVSGSGGEVTFDGTIFPKITFTSVDAGLSVAKSATLTGSTPFGLQYGTSSGKTYLSSAIASGKPEGTLTLTFATPPVPGTWSMAFGDVDAENLQIRATDASGQPVNTGRWAFEPFNYAGDADVPTWDPATGRLNGNVLDTNGASAWVSPSNAVKTITITQIRGSGFPQYQLWIAADIITEKPVPSPTATAAVIPTAPAGKVVICHATSSRSNPYIEMTVSQDSIDKKNGHATHTGPIYPEDEWGDIIPPFTGFEGANWPAGARILNNNCETGGEALRADLVDPLSTETPSASASAVIDEVCTTADTRLVNGDFEQPVIPAKSYRQLLDSDVPGWFTTASDRKIEIWSTGFQGVTSPEGNQFAEINATQEAELYQVVDTVPGQKLVWSLAHRARGAGAAGDTMSVNIGPSTGAPNSTTTFTDALPAGWVRHTGEYTVPAGQTKTRFGFQSGPTASGNKSIGNFLDDIYFTTTECFAQEKPVPLPTSTASPSTSASPSPSASPSGSTSASPSASGSASPSPSGSASAASASPSPSASASPSGSASGSPSASASASASPSASASATATPAASPSATPTATPSASATPTPTATPETVIVDPTDPRPTPVPVDPKTPTTIDPGPGNTITDAGDPNHGTVVVRDGDVVYTPEPGYVGPVEIPVTIRDREGAISKTVITLNVGEEQKARVNLPDELRIGSNLLLAKPVVTNARQRADVTVECTPTYRLGKAGGAPLCITTRSGGRTMVEVNAPAKVTVTISAPGKGAYGPYEVTKTYRVRFSG